MAAVLPLAVLPVNVVDAEHGALEVEAPPSDTTRLRPGRVGWRGGRKRNRLGIFCAWRRKVQLAPDTARGARRTACPPIRVWMPIVARSGDGVLRGSLFAHMPTLRLVRRTRAKNGAPRKAVTTPIGSSAGERTVWLQSR